ncbi:HalOD1 output domain-containing protein [Halosimplex salinum]|uniref:HalOD1 output domain-containing protein n=1 Tax=Halosimplex salinum TaxID=1710538 RepID=UPI0019D01595|nr:HalOD1 output domain-containing protein [Halosimplex salinum]
MEIAFSIVSAVAERESVSPTDLPPLYTAVDPDTLEMFVESPLTEAVSVEFDYCGYTVDVSGARTVEVCEFDRVRTHSA